MLFKYILAISLLIGILKVFTLSETKDTLGFVYHCITVFFLFSYFSFLFPFLAVFFLGGTLFENFYYYILFLYCNL